VALLCSVWILKRSPFWILDELDAPLEESDTGRFLKMLDKSIGKSQFVIVSYTNCRGTSGGWNPRRACHGRGVCSWWKA
jgi:hypothetical protein